MEFLIRDRLSWLRFLGFDLGAPTPDRNTIWTFRERLIRAWATEELFATFDRELRRSGYLAMGGQIVDATLVSAPKQRNTDDEKQAIKAGRRAAEIRPDQPTKAAQTDTQARWTVKTVRRREPAGTQRRLPEIAIPVFDYKSRIAIDRAYGFIRRSAVTEAACHGGRISHIHRKQPPGRVMPKATARANTRKSAVRTHIEHVFAHQKDRMGLVIRTIGLKRAEAKIGLANLAYNFQRLIFHERRTAMA